MTDQRGKILIFVAWIHIFFLYFYHTPEGKTTLKITRDIRDIRGTPFNGVPLISSCVPLSPSITNNRGTRFDRVPLNSCEIFLDSG
jgi:hypothetical protein